MISNPIKVAYILTIFPKLSETFIIEEILELERQGVEILIIALEKSNETECHDMVKTIKAKVIKLNYARKHGTISTNFHQQR